MALDKKALDEILRKEYGIVLPEFQQTEKFVTMAEFGIGIQNTILKASLCDDEEKAKINKMAEAYIVRAGVIMKQAGEAAEGSEMQVPMVPIYEGAQVDKVLATADGKPTELALASEDRDMFKKLLDGLGKLGETFGKTQETPKKEVTKEEKPDEEVKKNAPYVWAHDMALELATDKTPVEKKDDEKPENKKVEKKERTLKTEEDIQKAADDKKTEIQKAADADKTKAKEAAEKAKKKD